ncbi:MAG: DUF4340 domain-containing protein [Gammaproteobacteria bacterium]
MNSRTLLNLALLILVGVGAMVVVYLPGLEKPAAQVALTTLNPTQVTRIQILRSGQPEIQLVKQGQGWIMTAPFKLPANAEHVGSLVALAQAPSLERFAVKPQDLDKFKLAEPRVRLRLNDTEIAFGDTEALAQRRYVLVGDTLHLVNEMVYDKLNATPTMWVSTMLLPPDSKLRELALPGMALIQQADGHWNLTPHTTDVSMDAINTLIDEWTRAQALQVKPYESATAQGTVVMRLQASENPVSFEITARVPELVLARPESGVQYHLPAELAERLLKLPLPETAPESGNAVNHEATPHVH